jgi:hypothetical protein
MGPLTDSPTEEALGGNMFAFGFIIAEAVVGWSMRVPMKELICSLISL